MKKQRINIAAALLLSAFSLGSIRASLGETIPEVVAVPEIKTDPYVRLAGDRVLVNYLNLSGATVVVKVVDEENRLLYFEKFTDEAVVEKAINFAQANKGMYKVEIQVTGGSRKFSETLKVVR